MTKTPNPEPEEIEPITPDGHSVRSDDVGPYGTAPMSGRVDKRRDRSPGPPGKQKK